MWITRRGFIAGILAMSVVPARAAETAIVSGPAFGAGFRAVIGQGVDAGMVAARIAAVVERVDLQMSPFRRDSELSRFNARADLDWHALPEDFRVTLAAALDLAGRTEGAFDPTVGGLVGRYGFGPVHGGETGSYRELELAAAAVRKRDPELTLDLCGIAKGHALDRVFAELEPGEGILVELGGEIRARGRHPSGRAWHAAIERPDGQGIACAIRLDDAVALATSGDAVHSYRIGSRLYNHIMDGRKRVPADGSIASVSVLAASATEADGLATALYSLGAGAGVSFAASERIAALFQIRRGDGRLFDVMTGAFRDRIVWAAAS